MAYQDLVKKIMFSSEETVDDLFKSTVLPFEKDAYRFNRSIDILGRPEGKNIYELGMYPGTGIYFFGEKNYMTGLGKSSPEFSAKIRDVGHQTIDLDFENFEIEEQHFENADIVLAMEIIEHIRNPLRFLTKIVKLIKPQGQLYLTTNNSSYIGYILKLIFNKPILDSIFTEGTFYPGHTRYYSLMEMREILENLGLEIMHSNRVNFLPPSKLYKNEFFGRLKNITVKACPLMYSSHIELLAKKK